jgi:hypothetical protein
MMRAIDSRVMTTLIVLLPSKCCHGVFSAISEIYGIAGLIYSCLPLHIVVVPRCIYTGTVEVTPDVAQDLLRAADQYLLEGLKRLCEYAIAQDLTVENVANVYELAEAYHALSLRHTCVLFILKQHEQMSNITGYPALTQRIVPEIRDYLHRILRPQPPVSPEL